MKQTCVMPIFAGTRQELLSVPTQKASFLISQVRSRALWPSDPGDQSAVVGERTQAAHALGSGVQAPAGAGRRGLHLPELPKRPGLWRLLRRAPQVAA